MNCDEAFDRMTLPGAPADGSLSRHLSGCARCRAMQETLSPAIDWLRPSDLTPEQYHSPSAYVHDEAVKIAERAARGLTQSAVRTSPRRPASRRLARWLTWVAIAGVICLAVFIPQPAGPRETATARSATAVTEGCLWQMPAARVNPTFPTADQVVASCVACHFTLP